MRVVFDTTDHEIGQVTILVGDHIDESILLFISMTSNLPSPEPHTFIVNYLLRELN